MDTTDYAASKKRKCLDFQKLPLATPLREMKSAYKRNQITLETSNGASTSNTEIRRHLDNISHGIYTKFNFLNISITIKLTFNSLLI